MNVRLRGRIAAILASSTFVIVASSCNDDEAGDGSDGGRAGSSPGGSHAGGRSSGGASYGGEPSGGTAIGGREPGPAGTHSGGSAGTKNVAGSGGSSAGSGGETAGSGGETGGSGGQGGSPSAGGAGSGGESGALGWNSDDPNKVGACYNSGVGTCCNTRMCFGSPAELNSYLREQDDDTFSGLGVPDTGGAGGAGGATSFANGCPDITFSWWCGEFRPGTAHQLDDKCCYVINEGGCCGRPFLVRGEQRLPGLAFRADWCGAVPAVDAQELDPDTRAALTALWVESARLEHASVAAFARFVLDLLALGAPAALVSDAQRAGADEIEHARACYALASRYAGTALGPDRLDTSGACDVTSLASVAALAVTEGCVGETLAAALAERQACTATDAAARAALLRIAEDEARHAELAWRFVVWALETGDASVHAAVREAFERALSQPPTAGTDPNVDRSQFRAHGGLLPSERVAAAAEALEQIIEPSARLLFEGDPGRGARSTLQRDARVG